MAKICMTERTPKKNCDNCEHYKYDVTYGEKCCYAVPNEHGEVHWAPLTIGQQRRLLARFALERRSKNRNKEKVRIE